MYQTVSLRNNFWCIVLLLVVSCNSKKERLPYYNSPDFTPLFLNDAKTISDSATHKIAPFSFINQDGKTITNKNVVGKIHVANFIFTRCGSICPTMTTNLKKVSNNFENDPNVVFLSYSVTPWIDSVPRLKEYKQNHQINNPNWHFLTGDKSKIYTLARTSYFAEEDLGFSKDSTNFLHTEHVLLIDSSQRIRGIYNGTLKLDMEQLIIDINTLKKED
ncbi:MAG TPA: SCO family protein [Chitinophagales bacterium]